MQDAANNQIKVANLGLLQDPTVDMGHLEIE
jgi:hypothetical protein